MAGEEQSGSTEASLTLPQALGDPSAFAQQALGATKEV